MKNFLILLLPVLLLFNCCLSQGSYSASELQGMANDIKKEALILYRSEVTSWNGTDAFMKAYPGSLANIGGYFSYVDSGKRKCIFFSKDSNTPVIGSVSFGDLSDNTKPVVDLTARDFTALEHVYYALRQKTQALIKEDSFFKHYASTDLNLIPVVYDDRKVVYILCATRKQNVLVLGNDYLVRFDDSLNVTKRIRLHESLIVLERNASEKEVVGGIHTHVPGHSPFMTATDLCTLMLYKDVLGISKHVVVSQDYITIWDGGEGVLITPSPQK